MDTERATPSQADGTQVGLILVHGIGEQGRFEHLDAHIRGIIGGFKRSGARVTVEIMSAESAPFHSAQDTWRGGPESSLRLLVEAGDDVTTINVHEVWWADINEPYSLMKQIRFWVWGLSVWNHPSQTDTKRSGNGIPIVPTQPVLSELSVRVRLFLIGCFFLLSSLTIGLVTLVAKRLFNLNALNVVKTFVNYLSSVKLYNQSQRRGAGPASNADFLDTIGEPPRDSIRRRMIRTICDVAANRDYARWYILAHSQGSVIAFNGLMEPGSGWVGYLDEARLQNLRRIGMVFNGPPDAGAFTPARPIWSCDGETVDRMKIFERFSGILTYGSPLEKFQAIWRGRVPVFEEAAFAPHSRWINVFDPLDAVSGEIRSWDTAPAKDCPAVENIGYKASRVLLLGHVKYLDCPRARGNRLKRVRALGTAAASRWRKGLRLGSKRPKDAYGSRLADRVADWLLHPARGFR